MGKYTVFATYTGPLGICDSSGAQTQDLMSVRQMCKAGLITATLGNDKKIKLIFHAGSRSQAAWLKTRKLTSRPCGSNHTNVSQSHGSLSSSGQFSSGQLAILFYFLLKVYHCLPTVPKLELDQKMHLSLVIK